MTAPHHVWHYERTQAFYTCPQTDRYLQYVDTTHIHGSTISICAHCAEPMPTEFDPIKTDGHIYACGCCDRLFRRTKETPEYIISIPDPKGNEDCEGICQACFEWLDSSSLSPRS